MQISIMIVEDESLVAEELRWKIESFGYEVAAVTDTGEEAIELAAEKKPDLALMDIMLAGDMKGTEAAAKIYAKNPIPIIFLTAYSDATTMGEAIASDPCGYLIKPFDDGTLRTTIEVAIHKHAVQRKLTAEKRRMSAILESIDDGIIVTDLDGMVVYMNAKAEELTEWTLANARDVSVDTILNIVPDDHHDPRSTAKIILESGQPFRRFLPIHQVSANGKTRMIEENATPLRDDTGKMIGCIVAFRDVGQSSELQDQIFMRDQAFDALPVAVFIVEKRDDVTNFVYANKRFLKLTGYDWDDLCFCGLPRISRAGSQGEPEAVARVCMADNVSKNVIAQCICKDKSDFSARFVFTPLITPDGRVGQLMGVVGPSLA